MDLSMMSSTNTSPIVISLNSKACVMEKKCGYISLIASSLQVLFSEAHCHSVKTIVLYHIKRKPNTKGL